MEENKLNPNDGNALDKPHAVGYATSNKSVDEEGNTIRTIGNDKANGNERKLKGDKT